MICSYAMHFENLLKHEIRLLNRRSREYHSMKENLHEKEQSSSVEKQFILANKVSDHILGKVM